MLTDAELAIDLVRQAGALAARMRAEGVSSERKTSISDIVTAADRAAENLVVSRLNVERPADGLVGEEGAARPSTAPGDRTWFIDPVDGTYNYASGLPEWCSAVALTDVDGVAMGAVCQPAVGELWIGGRDLPTMVNGEPLPRLRPRGLGEVSIAAYLHPTTLPDDAAREPLLRAWRAAATVRMLGSGSVELAAVAAGRLGAYVQCDCLDWDWYPGQALVHGAGGTTAVFEKDGHRWHVAANERATEEIVACLKG